MSAVIEQMLKAYQVENIYDRNLQKRQAQS
mgnify:CR=1 FL=1